MRGGAFSMIERKGVALFPPSCLVKVSIAKLYEQRNIFSWFFFFFVFFLGGVILLL